MGTRYHFQCAVAKRKDFTRAVFSHQDERHARYVQKEQNESAEKRSKTEATVSLADLQVTVRVERQKRPTTIVVFSIRARAVRARLTDLRKHNTGRVGWRCVLYVRSSLNHSLDVVLVTLICMRCNDVLSVLKPQLDICLHRLSRMIAARLAARRSGSARET